MTLYVHSVVTNSSVNDWPIKQFSNSPINAVRLLPLMFHCSLNYTLNERQIFPHISNSIE